MASTLYKFVGHYDRNSRFERLQIKNEKGDGVIELVLDAPTGTELTEAEYNDALQYVKLEKVDKDGIPVEQAKEPAAASGGGRPATAQSGKEGDS